MVGDAAPSQSGVFVPAQGRLVDTRNGTGGVVGPVAANAWTPIQVLGQVGIPATGAKAVVLTLTAVNPSADNWTQLASNTERPDTQTTNLLAGANEILSNTSIVPIGSDGKIALRTSVSQHYVIEVQGYFTAGDTPAPGGYVPIVSKRMIDTRDGTGTAAGAWADWSTHTVKLKGTGGIPETAGAVFANVILISQDPNPNTTPTLYPFPGGSSDPGAPLHYRGGTFVTGVGTTLDLNAAGEVSFRVGYSQTPVHVVIDVEGYFDGQVSDSTYTSLNTRVHDSRSGAAVPAGGSVAVQIAGVNGLPAASAELAGVTMNLTVMNDPNATQTGWFRAYPSDEPEQPQSQVNYSSGGDTISNVIVVRPGAVDGKIIVKNMGSASAHFVIDAQGWFTNAHLLPPAAGNNGAASGNRGAASMNSRSLSDAVTAAWNPTNGNTVLTGRLLHVTGVGQDMNVTWRYNSLNDARPTLNLGRLETALRVDAGGAVTYTAPDGGWYTFTPTGTNTWAMPPGLNASLTKPAVNEYRIRFNDSGVTNIYTDDGVNYSLARSIDAHPTTPNTITYAYVNGRLDKTTDTQGRVMKYEYLDTRNLNQPSKITDQSISRSVTLEYAGAQGRLSKITDATGVTTAFAYNTAGKLATYTDARTNRTTFEYDTTGRTTKTIYAAGTGTGPGGESAWTAAYPSATSTTLTDPNNRTATYTHNAARQVTLVTDPNGNTLTGAFDAHDNRTSSTDGLGNITNATYNTNNSLTKVTSPAGAQGGAGGESSFSYPTAAGDPLLNYRPSEARNSENQPTVIEYDPNTKAPAKTTTPGAAITEAAVTRHFYQGDVAGTTCGAKTGSLCRTTDGKSNTTTYGYDAQGNPVTITRPAPLGAITNTFDAAGRLLTSKDGNSQTRTYTYDNNDRITQVRTGATCTTSTCVSTTFDANGNQTQRTDAAGTTTFAYDPQNRATGKTIGAVTTTVAYDKASNITSFTDPTGTVNYRYDAANRLTSLAEPGGSCPATPAFPNTTSCTGFDYDKNNRRIGTKYPNGVKNTTVFDNAGRLASITATDSAGVTLTTRSYTYTTVPTGTGTKDGSLRASMSDGATTTTYGYDARSRLTSAVATGAIPSSAAWEYDLNSNRVKETKGTTAEHSLYNAADQLCWTGTVTGACDAPPAGAKPYAYDANGNTTTGPSITAGYNAFDQNTSTTSAGTTTNYAYAGTTNTERTTAGNTAFLNGSLGITRQTTAGATTSFIRDPNGGLISMRTNTGAKHYYTTDALGSVILLTDTNQTKTAEYAYDSWGNTTATGAQAAANPWQYAGGYKDTTTGYTKFGARYYNPTTGRFTQPDPSGQETNTYLYAGANPITNTDPSGLSFLDGFAGELVGGVIGIVGVALGATVSKTLPGVILSAGIGCLAAGANDIIGQGSPDGGVDWGTALGACAGGAVVGAATFGVGRLIHNPNALG